MSVPLAVFVHPTALCESEEVGAGTQIWAFAHVMRGATIGADCNIGDHAFIETGAQIGDRVTIKNQAMVWDGVEIGDDVFIGPGACFTNDRAPRSPRASFPAFVRRYSEKREWLATTRVEHGASLGARCVIVAGVTIGPYAMIAAGAVVTRDVPAYGLAVGFPARHEGWVCRCGSRLRRAESTIWRCTWCGEGVDERILVECTSLAESC